MVCFSHRGVCVDCSLSSTKPKHPARGRLPWSRRRVSEVPATYLPNRDHGARAISGCGRPTQSLFTCAPRIVHRAVKPPARSRRPPPQDHHHDLHVRISRSSVSAPPRLRWWVARLGRRCGQLYIWLVKSLIRPRLGPWGDCGVIGCVGASLAYIFPGYRRGIDTNDHYFTEALGCPASVPG
ncbi:hypothetical protein C8Q78DRAFT_49068 [Trametes maxima]|nr:hypothetical protein C8Q78DRAFT_49068 [Trametes maxima]